MSKEQIAEDVDARESQRILREHDAENLYIVERLNLGMPTGRFDVYRRDTDES